MFVLKFYGPVNPMGFCRARKRRVNITALDKRGIRLTVFLFLDENTSNDYFQQMYLWRNKKNNPYFLAEKHCLI